MCPEHADQSKWMFWDADGENYLDDVEGDAVARCSDCDNLPAETECLTCCNDVTVDFSGTIDRIQDFKGSFSVDPDLKETAGGIPVYKKNDNDERCLWRAKENKYWVMGKCESSGSNSGFGFQTSSSDWLCPHNGITWEYYDSGTDDWITDESIKVECNKGCASDPPSAPSGATSNWEDNGKNKNVGTIVSYTCPDPNKSSKAVCDGETLDWDPAIIPAC